MILPGVIANSLGGSYTPPPPPPTYDFIAAVAALNPIWFPYCDEDGEIAPVLVDHGSVGIPSAGYLWSAGQESRAGYVETGWPSLAPGINRACIKLNGLGSGIAFGGTTAYVHSKFTIGAVLKPSSTDVAGTSSFPISMGHLAPTLAISGPTNELAAYNAGGPVAFNHAPALSADGVYFCVIVYNEDLSYSAYLDGSLIGTGPAGSLTPYVMDQGCLAIGDFNWIYAPSYPYHGCISCPFIIADAIDATTISNLNAQLGRV